MSAYCTSKYAITGLTETLRLELESSNVHVCAVHPSVTNTDFLKRTIFPSDQESSQELRQQMSKLLESPLASKAEDVAEAVWQMVQHPQAEVVVGSAAVPTALYRLFPGVSKWVMQQAT
jgi:short-subunit dehydrogenase